MLDNTKPEHGAYPQLWLICPGTMHWRTLISVLPVDINADSLLAGCRASMISLPSSLNLCGTLTCCHSLCEFIYATVLLCLEDFPWSHLSPLALFIFLSPLLQSSLSPGSVEGVGRWPQLFFCLLCSLLR